MNGTGQTVALIVTDAHHGAHHGDDDHAGLGAGDLAHEAQILLAGVDRWEVVSLAPAPPDVRSGQTGFAGPVLSPEEATRLGTQERVAALGEAAGTARGLGATPAVQHVVTGDASDVVDLARDVGAAVIVVQGSQHHGLVEALLPRSASQIVRHAPCPVLWVPTRSATNPQS